MQQDRPKLGNALLEPYHVLTECLTPPDASR
jgi:hypothetical protein